MQCERPQITDSALPRRKTTAFKKLPAARPRRMMPNGITMDIVFICKKYSRCLHFCQINSRVQQFARKHAIKFPSEEFALPLGLARRVTHPVRQLAEARKAWFPLRAGFPRRAVGTASRWSEPSPVPSGMRDSAPCPLGLREGFLNELLDGCKQRLRSLQFIITKIPPEGGISKTQTLRYHVIASVSRGGSGRITSTSGKRTKTIRTGASRRVKITITRERRCALFFQKRP